MMRRGHTIIIKIEHKRNGRRILRVEKDTWFRSCLKRGGREWDLYRSLWLDPLEPVGRRVFVFWPKDNQWYEGAVDAYCKRTGAHILVYDDGFKEAVILNEERIAYVENFWQHILRWDATDKGEIFAQEESAPTSKRLNPPLTRKALKRLARRKGRRMLKGFPPAFYEPLPYRPVLIEAEDMYLEEAEEIDQPLSAFPPAQLQDELVISPFAPPQHPQPQHQQQDQQDQQDHHWQRHLEPDKSPAIVPFTGTLTNIVSSISSWIPSSLFGSNSLPQLEPNGQCETTTLNTLLPTPTIKTKAKKRKKNPAEVAACTPSSSPISKQKKTKSEAGKQYGNQDTSYRNRRHPNPPKHNLLHDNRPFDRDYILKRNVNLFFDNPHHTLPAISRRSSFGYAEPSLNSPRVHVVPFVHSWSSESAQSPKPVNITKSWDHPPSSPKHESPLTTIPTPLQAFPTMSLVAEGTTATLAPFHSESYPKPISRRSSLDQEINTPDPSPNPPKAQKRKASKTVGKKRKIAPSHSRELSY